MQNGGVGGSVDREGWSTADESRGRDVESSPFSNRGRLFEEELMGETFLGGGKDYLPGV